jgi:hypothetical protein
LFLKQKEENLQSLVANEETERRKILGQVYSLILSWRTERLQSKTSINTNVVQETKSG